MSAYEHVVVVMSIVPGLAVTQLLKGVAHLYRKRTSDVRGLPVLDPSNFFRVALVVLSLIVMRSASERVHATVWTLAASLLVAFITLFQFRLA